MLLQLFGFSLLAGIIFLTTTTVEKKPELRIFWMIVGCLMFFIGVISLVVNSVVLTLDFMGWVEEMGTLGSFLFKLGLVFGGIAVVVLASHSPDTYDEYFDGNKYK